MTNSQQKYFTLDPMHTDPKRIKKEREKAQKLKKSQWWLTLKNRGICHYCERKFKPSDLTMDHILPIARGGVTAPGNVVPACRECNASKKLESPIDDLFAQIARENQNKETD